METKTLFLEIQYDGAGYSGWQLQKNSPSVEGKIEKALKKVFDLDLNVVGSGRTDKGVHASGQVASVKLDFDCNITPFRLCKALNSCLPLDIRVSRTAILDGYYNARFDAIRRTYKYYLLTKQNVFARHFSAFIKYPMDENKLITSAEPFLGKHDFTAFSKNNPYTLKYVCNVDECYWMKTGEGALELTVSANRFVYGMIRSMVGAMIDVARGRRTNQELSESLKRADRSVISTLAPAEGLFLHKIEYPYKVFENE